MKILICYLVLSFLLAISSCKDKAVNPPDDNLKPPGYQENIPWPSLADSPWPMEHADAQNTGRSKNAGPILGIIDRVIDSVFSNTGIVVGVDSTLYFACQSELKAYSFEGILKWKINFNSQTLCTPIVGCDGTIYSLYSNVLAAVNPNGSIKWQLAISAFNCGGMNIGLDGTIYFADSGIHTLYAVSKRGSLLWKIMDDRIAGWNSPVFSPDGKVIYLPGNNLTLLSINTTIKNIIWSFGNIFSGHGPVVDSDGNIYIYSRNSENNKESSGIFSLNSDGAIRWIFETNQVPLNAMTIDKNGNLIFGSDTLYSLDYSGNLNWFIPIHDYITFKGLVCDLNSNIYFLSSKFFSNTLSINCISGTGVGIFSIDGLNGMAPSKPPALIYNNLIAPTFESNISYIIK